MNTVVKRVGEFYLRGLVRGAAPPPEAMALWYHGARETDEAIRAKFTDDVVAAGAGAYDELESTPEGLVTLFILLDQFPRNIYRGSARQFDHDPKARALAKRTIASGADRALDAVERMFVYLPLEHSEDLADQHESVRVFQALHEEAPEPQKKFCGALLDFAIKHRDPIEQYGRFPHRNEMLGRESTEAELAYLAAGGGFGAKK